MSKPALKIVNGPSSTQEGLSQAVLGGTASLVSALSDAVDLIPHDDLELRQFLTFRRGIADQAARRSRWFGGRLYNAMAGEDPDYVQLSGTHLRQTLAECSVATPDFVTADGEYALRLDYVNRALEALKARIPDKS